MFPSRYWREIPQRYRLEAAKCSGCGKISFPPRSRCPKCGKTEFEKEILPDNGAVVTFAVVHVAPPQFSEQTPYAVGIVELENGVRSSMSTPIRSISAMCSSGVKWFLGFSSSPSSLVSVCQASPSATAFRYGRGLTCA